MIGVPTAPEKTKGPSSVLTFAGIELDCLKFEARLSQVKVDKRIEGIEKARGRNKITLRDLFYYYFLFIYFIIRFTLYIPALV